MPKYTLGLQAKYRKDKASTLRELAEQARLEETRESLLKSAKTAEATARGFSLPTNDTNLEEETVRQHDRQLLALAQQLEDPSAAMVAKSFFRALLSGLGSSFRFIGQVIKVVLMSLCFLVVTGGMVYSLVYCVKFGLGTQGTFGCIAFAIANAALYTELADRAMPIGEKWITAFVVSFLCIVILWISTTVFALPADSNLGVVVDQYTGKITDVIHPHQRRWMKAPSFMKDEDEWFMLYPFQSVNELKVKSANVVMTTNLSFSLKAHIGDLVHIPLEPEQAYRDGLREKIGGILPWCFDGDRFDSKKCERFMEEQLSNDLFAVKVQSVTLTETQTYNPDEDK